MLRFVKIIYSQLCDKLGRFIRIVFRNNIERKKLKNNDFTILSQNCIGSIMYHDLGQKFCSPTINMLFKPNEFIKFLNNLDDYLKYDIVFINTNKPYPVGVLKDITIQFVHYNSEEEVKDSWNRRKKRINWNNLFVICCDEGLTDNDIIGFDELPYKNKIIFLSRPHENVRSGIYCRDFKDKTDARLLNYSNPFGKRYYQRYVDYIEFLNENGGKI